MPWAEAFSPDEAEVVAATDRWLAIAVVGLGLCPFAGTVRERGLVRFSVSRALDIASLQRDLEVESKRLAELDAAEVETTLLIHPGVLTDFDDYARFLSRADRTVARLGLRGEIQIASFHPHYRFAGSTAEDPANCTNRSPFPMLQLLRERSVERAVAEYPDTRRIYRRNMVRLRQLGAEGWAALWSEGAERTARKAP